MTGWKAPRCNRSSGTWHEQLAGAPQVLELPTDFPRPAWQSFRGTSTTRVVSKDVARELAGLSQREGVTLFMTLLAAFYALLRRYTGQDDLVVGSPIANRTRIETEALIGLFFNNLVLRTDVSGTPTFRELLARVQSVALGAYAHADVPFERLVEHLQPDRTLSYTPLFQVVCVLQNTPVLALDLPGVTLRPVDVDNGTSKYDLVLEMFDEPEGLRCRLGYSTDSFHAATMERLLGHFETMLRGIVANPDARVASLPLLTADERDQLVRGWNETRAVFPDRCCVHELFERQADRTPDAVAVLFRDTRVTFGELNARSNRVARTLREHGVGPDLIVGLCTERSIEMIVGLLGILKAGGA